MKAWVVLTAAGSGSRLGASIPKALVDVDGKTILELALERIIGADLVEGVVVTCPESHVEDFEKITQATCGDSVQWRVVVGGRTRQGSVFAALLAIAQIYDGAPAAEMPVLVHDAARCLAPTSLFERVIEALNEGSVAVIPVLPVVDTVKVVDSSTGMVRSTPDRSSLRIVQTPQGFRWEELFHAHVAQSERAESERSAATDDSALVEFQGVPVMTVAGDNAAFKVTIAKDVEDLRAVLKNPTNSEDQCRSREAR